MCDIVYVVAKKHNEEIIRLKDLKSTGKRGVDGVKNRVGRRLFWESRGRVYPPPPPPPHMSPIIMAAICRLFTTPFLLMLWSSLG